MIDEMLRYLQTAITISHYVKNQFFFKYSFRKSKQIGRLMRRTADYGGFFRIF